MTILSSTFEMEKYYQTSSASTGAATFTWNYPDLSGSYALTPCSSYRDGIQNRNWKRDIARCRNATTPFTGVKQWYNVNPMSVQAWGATQSPPALASFRKRAYLWSLGVNAIPGLPTGSLTNTAENSAATRFNKSLESILTLFQGGTALGELRETLRMIRDPAKSLRRKLGEYLDVLKKRRRGSPTAKRKILADTWLEHSFGWLPLLSDLDDARQYLARRKKQLEREIIPVIGSAWGEEALFGFASQSAGVTVQYSEFVQKGRASVRYKGAVSSAAASGQLINASAMGLAPRNFVPTLWELLPWSFAIDYFTNIGEVLTSWANQSIDLAWGCKTIRRQSKVTLTYQTSLFASVYFVEHFTSRGSIDTGHKRVDRSSITTPPIPKIQFEIPGMGTKWLNLAALAAGRRSMSPY